MATQASEINPDSYMIENIRILVYRSLNFWKIYGPITVDGFTFEGGYTDIINTGDGDFLTKDTLWDFKVSKNPPTNKHTLQILIYYLMGKHSGKPEYKNIQKIGIYNPRLNQAYVLDTSNIPQNIIKEVKEKVIGY